MKIQSFKRIVKENVKSEYRDLIDTIGRSVNVFAGDVINALNNNLTIDDNLNMQYKEIQVIVNSSGLPINTTQYKSTIKGKTRGIIIVKVENLTNSNTYPTGAVFVKFSENSQIITLDHITGLIANNKYNLTLLALG